MKHETDAIQVSIPYSLVKSARVHVISFPINNFLDTNISYGMTLTSQMTLFGKIQEDLMDLAMFRKTLVESFGVTSFPTVFTEKNREI